MKQEAGAAGGCSYVSSVAGHLYPAAAARDTETHKRITLTREATSTTVVKLKMEIYNDLYHPLA